MAHGRPVDERLLAGIRESIANARPDLKQERGDLLAALTVAVDEGQSEKIMAVLERLDIADHFPAIQRPDGRWEPQPMPGGWTSWYGWMTELKAWEEAPYRAKAAQVATADIAE